MKTLTAAQIGMRQIRMVKDFPNMTNIPASSSNGRRRPPGKTRRKPPPNSAFRRVKDDFMEAVSDPEVDFIKIATTLEVHLPIIQAAARAGKHIFCEKTHGHVSTKRPTGSSARSGAAGSNSASTQPRMAPSMNALRKQVALHKANPKHNPWQYVEKVREPLPEENLPIFLSAFQDESSSYGLGHLNPLTGGGAEIIGKRPLAGPCLLDVRSGASLRDHRVGFLPLSHGIHLRFSNGASMTLDFSCSGTFDYPKELFELTDNAALFRNLFFVEKQLLRHARQRPGILPAAGLFRKVREGGIRGLSPQIP